MLLEAIPAPTFGIEARLAVSAVVLVVLVLAGWLIRHRPGPFAEWTDSRIGTVAFFAMLAAVMAAAVLALVAVWDAVDPAVRFLGGVTVVTEAVLRAVLSLVLVAGAYIVTGIIHRVINEFTTGHDAISRHQSEIVYRTIQLSIYVVAVIAALGIWEFDLGGFLIGAGFLGIVVGMAARQTLGAVLAGFVLMFSRPFEIGDWIEIDDDEGIVTDITIVNTRLQTFDGEYVVIPNDAVSGSTITNRTRKGRLRIQVDVGVDYGIDIERAGSIAEEAMGEVEDILSVPKPDVVLVRFGDSSVVLGLRFWIDKPSARRKWRAQTAVIAAVKRAFDEEGIKIPFPQRELMGREEAGGLSLTGEDLAVQQSATDGGAE